MPGKKVRFQFPSLATNEETLRALLPPGGAEKTSMTRKSGARVLGIRS
jgi:hypothetical protein